MTGRLRERAGQEYSPRQRYAAYIKLAEEREMEIRFGAEYRAYQRRTPFLVPRFRSRP